MSLQIEIRPRWMGLMFEISYFLDGSDRQQFNRDGGYTWRREELPAALSELMEQVMSTAPEQPQTPSEGEDGTETVVEKFERADVLKSMMNPVVRHEDNELTGERTYFYEDGTKSDPQAAPASWRPNGASDPSELSTPFTSDNE